MEYVQGTEETSKLWLSLSLLQLQLQLQLLLLLLLLLLIPLPIIMYIASLSTCFSGCIWCLRHYATSQMVAGSTPNGVTSIFRRHNHSICTMALRLTQPLTGMSTRNIS